MDVLVIEDDAVSRLLLERRISQNGYHVDSVDSAEKALEQLKKRSYPILFLDIGLPGMSGLDLIRHIRNDDTDPPTYLLVGTGETGEERMREILDAGANDYVAKPYLKSALDTRLAVAGNTVESLRERSRLGRELTFIAKHDPLTGLFNRRQLEELLEESSRLERPSALFQVDLDQFKQINDRFGHPAGDQYLIDVARTLEKKFSKSSKIVRLGGDEFVVIADGLTMIEAPLLADEIIAAIREISVEDGQSVADSGASIGITELSADVAPSELLKQVDIACYRAKTLGKSRAQLYVPFSTELLCEDGFDPENKKAEDHLELWFQPICELHSGKVAFHEALLRFIPGEGKTAVDASMFMTEITRRENVFKLDRFVVRRACAALSNYPDLVTSVNVDASSICDHSFVRYIEDQLRQREIKGERLLLEITERNGIPDIPVARTVIKQLADLGVRCALDDLGAGFNSISLLKHLPIDLVKVDGELIHDLGNDRYNRSLIEALGRLAQGLNFQTVGEKIETEEEWWAASQLGIVYGQGHLIGAARREPYEQSELSLP